MKAIQTFYKGYHFRSRLEARWAVFFDALGIRWEYEPEGFELGGGVRYLPDFHIGRYAPGGHTYGPWIEVKGAYPSPGEIKKMSMLCEAMASYGIIVWGEPLDRNFICVHKEGHLYDGGADIDISSGQQLTDFMVWWPSLPPNVLQVTRAAQAARSARFEFGESGATT